MRIDIYILCHDLNNNIYWATLFNIIANDIVKHKESSGKLPRGISKYHGELIAVALALRSVNESRRNIPISLYIPAYAHKCLGWHVGASANLKTIERVKEYMGMFQDLSLYRIDNRSAGFKTCMKIIKSNQ